MTPKKSRGFAVMNKEQQRKIASRGGIEAHRKGTAHEFSSEEARRAGRKGGLVVSQDRSHMALIGRHGGQAKGSRPQMVTGALPPDLQQMHQAPIRPAAL